MLARISPQQNAGLICCRLSGLYAIKLVASVHCSGEIVVQCVQEILPRFQ